MFSTSASVYGDSTNTDHSSPVITAATFDVLVITATALRALYDGLAGRLDTIRSVLIAGSRILKILNLHQANPNVVAAMINGDA